MAGAAFAVLAGAAFAVFAGAAFAVLAGAAFAVFAGAAFAVFAGAAFAVFAGAAFAVFAGAAFAVFAGAAFAVFAGAAFAVFAGAGFAVFAGAAFAVFAGAAFAVFTPGQGSPSSRPPWWWLCGSSPWRPEPQRAVPRTSSVPPCSWRGSLWLPWRTAPSGVAILEDGRGEDKPRTRGLQTRLTARDDPCWTRVDAHTGRSEGATDATAARNPTNTRRPASR